MKKPFKSYFHRPQNAPCSSASVAAMVLVVRPSTSHPTSWSPTRNRKADIYRMVGTKNFAVPKEFHITQAGIGIGSDSSSGYSLFPD